MRPAEQAVTPQQRELDGAIRAAILGDRRITHALAYGSFTQGSADALSDLEYYVFLPEAERESFDVRGWLEAVAPVRHFVVSDFGTPNAVLDGLLRVELHVESDTRLGMIEVWPNLHIHPDAMLVKDTAGRLAGHLAALAGKPAPRPHDESQVTYDRLLNWLASGLNVLARGERVRALELLGWVRGGLLRLARLVEEQTGHWLTASRCAEEELSAAALARYARLTGPLDHLEDLYAEAWAWTGELAIQRPGLQPAGPELARDIDERLAALRGRSRTPSGQR